MSIKRTLADSLRFILCLPRKHSQPDQDAFRLADFSVFTARTVVRIAIAMIVAIGLFLIPLPSGIFKAAGAVILAFCAGVITAYFFPLFRQRYPVSQYDQEADEPEAAEQAVVLDAEMAPSIETSAAIVQDAGADPAPQTVAAVPAAAATEQAGVEFVTSARPRRRRKKKAVGRQTEPADTQAAIAPTTGDKPESADTQKKTSSSRKRQARKAEPVQAAIDFE